MTSSRTWGAFFDPHWGVRRKMAALPLPVAILGDLICGNRKWGHPRWPPEAEGPPFSSSLLNGDRKTRPILLVIFSSIFSFSCSSRNNFVWEQLWPHERGVPWDYRAYRPTRKPPLTANHPAPSPPGVGTGVAREGWAQGWWFGLDNPPQWSNASVTSRCIKLTHWCLCVQ